MTEQQVEIFARKLKDLNVPMDIGADPNAFSQVKIATGNMPEGFSTFEGLYLIHIIQILSKISDKYFEPMQQEEFELRLAELMADFQAKADEIVEKGFYQTYAKESDLLASKPKFLNQYAKALDVPKVYFWERTSAEGVEPIIGTWTDTGLSELDQAKKYTDTKLLEVLKKIGLKQADVERYIPILSDAKNKLLIGYDTELDRIEAVGLQKQIFEKLMGLKLTSDNTKTAVLTDATNKILIGYDFTKDEPILAGLNLKPLVEEIVTNMDLNGGSLKPTIAGMNHMLFYGQSLSTGATAVVILSKTQPYQNKTFSTGPRKDSAATSIIPLVEQFNNPSSDGYSNRGETCCSGAANYASRIMLLEKNIQPEDHKIFCSTAGHGGYRIDQLEKGTPWYNFLIEHVTEAKRLITDTTYKVQVICWVQGENDAVTNTQTPKVIYKNKLIKLQQDSSKDIKNITGQIEDVKYITYQLSYAAKTWSDQALAQLELVQENKNFGLSTPMYHMPYHTDNIHLTNVGYKWLGAYFGRAYTQVVEENRKPDYINPLVANLEGNIIKVKFSVPKKPLVLDVSTLANTTNFGFKVVDHLNNDVTISSIEVKTDDEVHITLGGVPANPIKVRYALDFLGAGINLTGGASGNLRDSTTDSCVIEGVTKPLYHICPHFQLNVNVDKGI